MAKTSRKKPVEPVAASSGTWFDGWERISPLRRHFVSLAILLIVAIWFMAPVLFSDRALVGGDQVHWSAMAQSLFAEEEATGHKPLWATNPFAGMPAYMISYDLVVPQIDDVARWLRQLMWPLSHLLILLGGVYGLVFLLTRDRLSAALSAAGFGLTTYLPILLVAGHNSKYVSLAYLPWLLWAFAFAIRKPTLLGGLLFAVAMAVNLRAGHVQITYYGVFMLGVWWLVEAIDALRKGKAGEFWQATAWLAGGGALALLMVAQPYLVQAEYKTFTVRGSTPGGQEGAMAWDYAMGWSQGPAELFTLLVADAFGGGGATYWGPKTFTAGPHYVGGIILLLAIIALWRARHRTVIAFAVAGVLMTLFSLGENLAWLNRLMFDHFPLFAAFRVPETWLSVVALVLAVLAGFGASEAIRHDRDAASEADRNRVVTVASIVGVLAMLLVVGFADSMLDFEQPQELERLSAQVARQRPDLDLRDPQVGQLLDQEIARRRAERADLFAGDARRSLLFVVLGAGLLLLVRRRRIPGWAAQLALVVLVVADLGGVGHRYLNEDALVRDDRGENPVPEYAFDRFLLDRRAEAGGAGHFRVLSMEGDPTVTARPAYFYESLGGYHGAKLRNYQDYIDSILFDGSRGLPNENALRIANVRYVVAGFGIPGMNAVHADEQTGMSVFEVPRVADRAWFVDSVEVVSDADAQWARIRSDSFDPLRSVVMTEDPGVSPSPRDSVSTTSVTGVSYGGDRIEFEVDTDRERVLVVSEIFYPAGWTARIDGEETPILPANYLFRGVVIPAGAHRVEMIFDPPTHRLGILVAAGATAVVYGLLVWLLVVAYRKRRSGLVV